MMPGGQSEEPCIRENSHRLSPPLPLQAEVIRQDQEVHDVDHIVGIEVAGCDVTRLPAPLAPAAGKDEEVNHVDMAIPVQIAAPQDLIGADVIRANRADGTVDVGLARASQGSGRR